MTVERRWVGGAETGRERRDGHWRHTAAGAGDARRGVKAAEAVSEAAQMSRDVHLSKVP